MTIVDLLAKQEGFEPCAYPDSEGYLTIGHGILIDDRKAGSGITEEESFWLLKRRVKARARLLDVAIPWWRTLNLARRTVLQSMAYQMGVSGLLGFKNTLAAMKRGDYHKAANGMRASKWARQTPGRANRMAEAMERGVLK